MVFQTESVEYLIATVPVDHRQEKWFLQWKTRMQCKTKEQNELDENLWMACRDYEWAKARDLISQGASGDRFNSYFGGISVIMMMRFEKQDDLITLMDDKFPNEYQKSINLVKYNQEIWVRLGSQITLNKIYKQSEQNFSPSVKWRFSSCMFKMCKNKILVNIFDPFA